MNSTERALLVMVAKGVLALCRSTNKITLSRTDQDAVDALIKKVAQENPGVDPKLAAGIEKNRRIGRGPPANPATVAMPGLHCCYVCEHWDRFGPSQLYATLDTIRGQCRTHNEETIGHDLCDKYLMGTPGFP